MDGIDLTTGCKNISNTMFVSGDDFGKIKVYSYPVCWPKVRLYLIHSSEIRGLCWMKLSSGKPSKFVIFVSVLFFSFGQLWIFNSLCLKIQSCSKWKTENIIWVLLGIHFEGFHYLDNFIKHKPLTLFRNKRFAFNFMP